MLKEKINNLLNTKGNNKKKIENLVYLLIILIITVIAINYIWNDKDTKNNISKQDTIDNNNINDMEKKNYEDDLERRLEDILSKINGVGKANVMITYSETTQVIPVYNKTEKTSSTDESDSGGGKRNIEEKDVSEEVVYTESNGKSQIATQKNINPKIEGAIIIAEGARDSNIKTNIIQAVEAVTGLATHKIQVFEKQS